MTSQSNENQKKHHVVLLAEARDGQHAENPLEKDYCYRKLVPDVLGNGVVAFLCCKSVLEGMNGGLYCHVWLGCTNLNVMNEKGDRKVPAEFKIINTSIVRNTEFNFRGPWRAFYASCEFKVLDLPGLYALRNEGRSRIMVKCELDIDFADFVFPITPADHHLAKSSVATEELSLSSLFENPEKPFETDDQTNFSIQCGSVEFHVHRVVLVRRSPYFAKMLTADPERQFEEAKEAKLVLQDQPSVVRKVLRYVYGLPVNFGEESLVNLMTMMHLFNMYEMPTAVSRCTSEISSKLFKIGEGQAKKSDEGQNEESQAANRKQVFEVLAFAHRLKLDKVFDDAVQTVKKFGKGVTKEMMSSLDPEVLERVIASLF